MEKEGREGAWEGGGGRERERKGDRELVGCRIIFAIF